MADDAREWLRAKGYHIAPKGRIRADLKALWDAHQREQDASDSVCGDTGADDSGTGRLGTKRKKRTSCGFCTVRAAHQHFYCPGSIDQGKAGVWTCLCYEKEHKLNG